VEARQVALDLDGLLDQADLPVRAEAVDDRVAEVVRKRGESVDDAALDGASLAGNRRTLIIGMRTRR
jgi:hypothetical protein